MLIFYALIDQIYKKYGKNIFAKVSANLTRFKNNFVESSK